MLLFASVFQRTMYSYRISSAHVMFCSQVIIWGGHYLRMKNLRVSYKYITDLEISTTG